MAINSNKVTRFDESIKLKIFLIASFFFVVFTNNYFSYEQSIVFGARDGVDYFLIAQNFPKIPYDALEYHRAWRFIMPTLIGFTGKILNIDIYLLFRIFVLLFCVLTILIFFEILKFLELNNFQILFLSSFIMFNPYLFRYFIACPTMINDLIFINATLVLVLGILKNNKIFFYIGILLSLPTRQNSIFLLISIIIAKFVFKKNSFFKIKDIILLIILFSFFFLLNNIFANFYSNYNNSYSLFIRFGLFQHNYTFSDFLQYHFIPLIILLPLFGYLIIEKKNFDFNKLNSELLTLISLFAFFLLSVAYVGGPITTGKNLIRLINLAYPLIILIGAASIDLKKHSLSGMRFYLFSLLFIIWSFHPTYSKIKILNFINFVGFF